MDDFLALGEETLPWMGADTVFKVYRMRSSIKAEACLKQQPCAEPSLPA